LLIFGPLLPLLSDLAFFGLFELFVNYFAFAFYNFWFYIADGDNAVTFAAARY
jgi:hypothetical protein